MSRAVVVLLLLLLLVVVALVVAIGGGRDVVVVVLVKRGGRHQLVQLRAAAGVEKAHGSLAAALVGEHDSADAPRGSRRTRASHNIKQGRPKSPHLAADVETRPSKLPRRGPAQEETTPRADVRSPSESDERAPHDDDNRQTATDLAESGNRRGERNQKGNAQQALDRRRRQCCVFRSSVCRAAPRSFGRLRSSGGRGGWRSSGGAPSDGKQRKRGAAAA